MDSGKTTNGAWIARRHCRPCGRAGAGPLVAALLFAGSVYPGDAAHAQEFRMGKCRSLETYADEPRGGERVGTVLRGHREKVAVVRWGPGRGEGAEDHALFVEGTLCDGKGRPLPGVPVELWRIRRLSDAPGDAWPPSSWDLETAPGTERAARRSASAIRRLGGPWRQTTAEDGTFRFDRLEGFATYAFDVGWERPELREVRRLWWDIRWSQDLRRRLPPKVPVSPGPEPAPDGER